jgi:hypothetical protein
MATNTHSVSKSSPDIDSADPNEQVDEGTGPRSHIQRTLTTTPIDAPTEASRVIPPESYRLPKTGVDQFFGCTRSFYYALEKAGRIRLIRIRGRAKMRGITLVPYEEMKRLVQEAAAQ